MSLEQEAFAIEDPFLKKALTLAVDSTDLLEIRKMLELEIDLDQHHVDAEAKVFECAGGYAPTVGIIGAVLGLIQVMKNLANIDEVGHGIAVSFVATVYGVGLANLFLLPAAAKIKARIHAETQHKELIVEGVAGIVEGMNPKLIRVKLESYGEEIPAAKVRKRRITLREHRGARETRDLWLAGKSNRRESRTVAGVLRGFHHFALCILCRDVRHLQGRQRKSTAGFRFGEARARGEKK